MSEEMQTGDQEYENSLILEVDEAWEFFLKNNLGEIFRHFLFSAFKIILRNEGDKKWDLVVWKTEKQFRLFACW